MSSLFAVAFTVSLFSAIGLLVTYTLTRDSRVAVKRFVLATRPSKPTPAAPSTGRRTGQFLADLIHNVRVRVGLSETSTLRGRITQAGYRGHLAADIYMAARVLGPVLCLAIASTISSNRGFWMISFPAIAYLLPDIVLTRLVHRRREKIRRSLPDAIDLLVICVDAGLGLDQAMLRVGQELGISHPEITGELLQINREQRAGKPRIDAWQDMEKRVDLPDLHAFVNMLMQTERFGTPISKALSNFADGLRLKRRQAAEEMAAKTTVKIIFPLVLFIFPCLFIVLLGPAGITIARGISTMNK